MSLTFRIELHKNNFDVNLLRAYVNLKMKNFDESLKDLTVLSNYLNDLKTNNVEPDLQPEREEKLRLHFSYTYNEMGQLLFEKEDYQNAYYLFKEAEKFNKNNIGLLCNLGDCFIVSFNS